MEKQKRPRKYKCTAQKHSVKSNAYGIPKKRGYLEVVIFTPSGNTKDTNELPISSGLPVGQTPEVPWAALISGMAIGLGMAVVVVRKSRIML
ncbi:MAG: hypothetical protein C7B43_04860 [Sulfobacillus benefaciens]|uniref:Uncharacterized protein n=1 Tax=Sulfobacillus benefaciens TaxID=453960 RepID=A0A2T2X8H8_9FIRM|nr:MAG: hypothetical protein C7B43_04860 [Sulfobacillus benefaciens]